MENIKSLKLKNMKMDIKNFFVTAVVKNFIEINGKDRIIKNIKTTKRKNIIDYIIYVIINNIIF